MITRRSFLGMSAALAAGARTPALHAQRVRIDTLVAGAAGRIGLPRIPPGTSDEEVVNGVAQYVDIDPLDRERLLERDGVLARAAALIDLLEKAIATPP